MPPYRRTRAVALAALVLSGSATMPSAVPAETGETLLSRILTRLESDLDSLRQFSFREEVRVERRTPTGEISSREQESSEVFHRDGLRMRRSLSDGRDGAPRADREPSLDLKSLASCFTFAPAAPAMLADRAALLLEFSARPGCLQASGRAERILGNLDGRLWVDAERYDLLRIEGRLRAPVTFGFGLFGKIESFDLEVERQAVDPGVFAMTRLEYHARGRVFPGRRFDLSNRRDRISFQRIPGEALSSAATTPSPRPASDQDPDLRNRS